MYALIHQLDPHKHIPFVMDGWRNIVIFCNFQKRAQCCRSGLFFSLIPKHRKFDCTSAQQSFYFQNITGTLKLIFFWLITPFDFNNNHQIKFCIYFYFYFLAPKWVNLYLNWPKEKHFFCFSSFWLLNKLRNKYCFRGSL